MRPEDRETLLWKLSETPDPAPPGDVPTDDTWLEAYRRGELSDDETRRCERLLAGSTALRQRLEEIGGVDPPTAPERVRRDLLERFAAPPAVQPSRRPGRRAWPWGLAAAAVLALAAGWWFPRQPLALPAYDVGIEALVGHRGPAPHTGPAEAYAETMVKITATVAETATRGIDVGLYRLAGDRLELVDDGHAVVHPDIKRHDQRGAVLLTAPAASLVGAVPGDHPIFVVVARRGDHPQSLVFENQAPEATLEAGDRRQAHRLTLRLLDPNPPPQGGIHQQDEENLNVQDHFNFSDLLPDPPHPIHLVRPGLRHPLGALSARC